MNQNTALENAVRGLLLESRAYSRAFRTARDVAALVGREPAEVRQAVGRLRRGGESIASIRSLLGGYLINPGLHDIIVSQAGHTSYGKSASLNLAEEIALGINDLALNGVSTPLELSDAESAERAAGWALGSATTLLKGALSEEG